MTATRTQACWVRVAARALARAGLVHAYGHCSMRLDADRFLVCPPRPMGLIDEGEACSVVPVDGPLPEGVLGEVSIHQRIYAARRDVGGICRSMPPDVMTLSTLGCTPKPRHGMGAYFHDGIPLWDDVQLVRTAAQARAVQQTMGDCTTVVMRGNGAVVAAGSLPEAVVLTWYLEDAARIELAVLGTGRESRLLERDEARQRATLRGRIFERMWNYLSDSDPEASDLDTWLVPAEGKI